MSPATAIDTLRDLSLHMVAVVLLLSGTQKAFGLQAFRRGLLFIPYMRVSWTYAIAYGLPFVEIALAVGLLRGLRIATVGAIGLFAAFSLVAILALRKRLAVPCNCFGGGARVLSKGTIAVNVVLILLTAIAAPAPARDSGFVSFVVAASLVLLVPMIAALGEMRAAARDSQGLVNS
jgi:hypothetical protein